MLKAISKHLVETEPEVFEGETTRDAIARHQQLMYDVDKWIEIYQI